MIVLYVQLPLRRTIGLSPKNALLLGFLEFRGDSQKLDLLVQSFVTLTNSVCLNVPGLSLGVMALVRISVFGARTNFFLLKFNLSIDY